MPDGSRVAVVCMRRGWPAELLLHESEGCRPVGIALSDDSNFTLPSSGVCPPRRARHHKRLHEIAVGGIAGTGMHHELFSG